MSPEYLDELASIADPAELWRLSVFDQMKLPPRLKQELDMGVALRRYADHIRTLRRLKAEKRSLLITPLSESGNAVRSIETPDDHKRLRDRDDA